jgi:MFS family permease
VRSSLLFPERPSSGFSAAHLFLGIGTIVGPVALGAFAGYSGPGVAFLVTGMLALLTAPLAAFAKTSDKPASKVPTTPIQEPTSEPGR